MFTEFNTVEQMTVAALQQHGWQYVPGKELPIVIGRHPVFIVSRPAEFGAAHPVYLDLAGGSYVRPETGVRCQVLENSRIASRPNQKGGADCPANAKALIT